MFIAQCENSAAEPRSVATGSNIRLALLFVFTLWSVAPVATQADSVSSGLLNSSLPDYLDRSCESLADQTVYATQITTPLNGMLRCGNVQRCGKLMPS